MPKISIVVPCYNEEKVLPLFYEAITTLSATMPEVEFEYVFVNDGSRDNTLEVLKDFAKKDTRAKYVSFSRNFGKEAALFAGLEYASGDFVAVMDADLQDPPEMIPEMYREITVGGFDCVGTRRVTRKGEPPIRSFFARMFYKLINKMTSTEIVDGARDYRLMTRQMVDSILSLREVNRFSKGLFSWVGFKTKWLEYENIKRAAGETKWSFWKLFLYSLDGIVAFTTVPLAISSICGVLFLFVSIIGIIITAVRELIFHNSAFGWTSTVCLILLLAGIQLFCIGILGQYLAKAYLEVKNRPIYIVKETNQEK